MLDLIITQQTTPWVVSKVSIACFENAACGGADILSMLLFACYTFINKQQVK